MSCEPIRLGDATDFIELRVLERGTAAAHHEGDLKLGVSVRFNDWAGEYDQVWIAKNSWAVFIGQLMELERVRKGQASLHAMSPDEFELHLQIIDPAGHLAARGFLSRYHWRGFGVASRSRIEYWIDIDPSLLRELVGAFAQLAAGSSCDDQVQFLLPSNR